MGIATKPYTFANGDIVDALKFNANYDVLYSEFNGNIDNANCKAAMGLFGTKLADAPNGVPTGKINDNAVTSAKLASDPTSDGVRAVTTNHIKDLAVVKAKLGAAAVSLDKLNVTFQTKTVTLNTGLVTQYILSASPIRKTNGSNYEFDLYVITGDNQQVHGVGGTGGFGGWWAWILPVVPTTPIPTVSQEVIAVYVANISFGALTITADVVILSINKT